MLSIRTAPQSAAAVVVVLLGSAPARADGVSVELRGSFVESVTAGGVTIDSHSFSSGRSTGEVSFVSSFYTKELLDL